MFTTSGFMDWTLSSLCFTSYFNRPSKGHNTRWPHKLKYFKLFYSTGGRKPRYLWNKQTAVQKRQSLKISQRPDSNRVDLLSWRKETNNSGKVPCPQQPRSLVSRSRRPGGKPSPIIPVQTWECYGHSVLKFLDGRTKLFGYWWAHDWRIWVSLKAIACA